MASPASEPRNLIRRDGEYWTVTFDGVTCHFRDGRGLAILAQLLGRPGEWLTARELLASMPSVATSHPDEGDPDSDEVRSDERARVNATRAVRVTLDRIAAHLPALAAHLAATIRTGVRCAYVPDPRVPITWTTAERAGRPPGK